MNSLTGVKVLLGTLIESSTTAIRSLKLLSQNKKNMPAFYCGRNRSHHQIKTWHHIWHFETEVETAYAKHA